jgi:hypothetical protein
MEGLAELRAAIDGVAAVDTARLSNRQLEDLLTGMHRERARLLAVEARVTAAFDLRGAWRDDGSRSMGAWLARHCRTSRRASRAQVRRAKRLRGMPLTAAALAGGEIDDEHVGVLSKLAGSPRKRVADAFGEAEDLLVGYAKTMTFADFVRACRYWEEVVDPDGSEDQAADDLAARRLHVSETFRGNVVIDGQLDPISGAAFATALKRIENELFQADWAEARAIHGKAACLEDLARTPAQRRADALVEMAHRAMTAPAGGKRPRPLFVFHVGYENSARRMCELATGTVIAPGQLLPYLTEADFERIVWGPDDEILSLSKRARFFKGADRRAMNWRDRHCQHPGCDEEAEFCQGDHDPDPWSHGGLTILSNGRLKCGSHNRYSYRQTHEPPP